MRGCLLLVLVACSSTSTSTPAAGPTTPAPPSVANVPATLKSPLPPATRIEAGKPFEKSIKAGESHRYRVELAAGHVISGVIMQKGIDVEVMTYDPTGKLLGTVDSPNGDNGPEPFVVEAAVAGTYDFEVRPFTTPVPGTGVLPPAEGRYEASVAILTPEAYAEVEANERFASERVRELWRAVRTHRKDLVEKIWNDLDGKSPIVEPYPGDDKDSLVTFVYRAQSPYVALVGGNGFREKPLVRLGDSDLWTLTMRVPADSRFDYAFIVTNGPPDYHRPFKKGFGRDPRWNLKLDPHNKKERFGMSRAELPAAPPQPWIAVKPDVAKGKIVPITIASKLLSENRKIGVYTPAGYDPKKKYPLVIVFDGEAYGLGDGAMIPLPTILDNLIAEKKIPPVVAALVANQGTRERDLPGSAPFSAFLANELVPKLRADFRAGLTAAETIVTGSSFGGLCSAYTVLHHSNVIGNALSQSGSFQFKQDALSKDVSPSVEGNWLNRDYAKTKKLPIRFYLDAGRFEEDLLTSNRHMRDVLVAKGYPVTYAEFSGGHDYWIWRHTIADGLIALLHK